MTCASLLPCESRTLDDFNGLRTHASIEGCRKRLYLRRNCPCHLPSCCCCYSAAAATTHPLLLHYCCTLAKPQLRQTATMKLQHVLMGSAAFAASVYGGYTIGKPMKALPQPAATAADEAAGSCAFDRLAGVYDSIIGSEEQWMFYGWLRWWLLRDAQASGSMQKIWHHAWHGWPLPCCCLPSQGPQLNASSN